MLILILPAPLTVEMKEVVVLEGMMDNVTPACDKCGGSRFLRYDVEVNHPNFGKHRHCDKCKAAPHALIARCWELSNLHPDTTEAAQFDNFRPYDTSTVEMFKAARDFARTLQGWLVLHGQGTGREGDRGAGRWGTGKSHLAEAITRFLLERQIPTLFMTAAQLQDLRGGPEFKWTGP